MRMLLVLLCMAVAASALTCNQDLKKLCKDKIHTLCKYTGPNCPGRKYFGVQDADKRAVVDAHNNLRRKIANGQETRGQPGPQPAAANMNKLQWDDNLAQVAQRWADQCQFGHDDCNADTRFSVGQNVFETYSEGSHETATENWNAAVQDWYNEVKDFSNKSIKPFQYRNETGHYSQAVWATSKYVGCGFVAYNGKNGRYYKYYICNYGPAGNVDGSTMYEQGKACSKCPGACENSLCV